ncbi:MAG: AI-2E family transporter [Bacteroidetes bacterium]|nr:AI-2E family transporter [Bacteroidota bacterium]
MTNPIRFPFYAKITFLLLGIYLFVHTLYIGQQIIVPIVYSVLISILLTPVVGFLEKRKINRVLAISIAIVGTFLLMAGLIYFIASQLSMFDQALPTMRQKLNDLQYQASQWISVHFNISIQRIDAWIMKTRGDLMQNGSALLGKTIITISGSLFAIFILPVYVFMILYYEPLLLVFMKKLFNKVHHEKLEDVMLLTKGIVQGYLVGLLIEAVIVAVMNAAALLIIGVDYAILIGIIGALLNMIPYIGGIVAVAIPMIIALITKDSAYYSLLVLLAYMLIQFIDNHYITPKIVASKVKINALIALIAVFVGNALWGIPGMFLALPVTGMLKVIFEHIESMKAWAFLLGDAMPASGRYIFNFSRRKKAAKV